MATTARMAQIEALLADDPDDSLTRYMLGMEYASSGDDAGAVRVFQDVIAREPYVPAFHMAGQALIRQEKLDEAAEMLKSGIAAAQKQSDFHALGEMETLLATID